MSELDEAARVVGLLELEKAKAEINFKEAEVVLGDINSRLAKAMGNLYRLGLLPSVRPDDNQTCCVCGNWHKVAELHKGMCENCDINKI